MAVSAGCSPSRFSILVAFSLLRGRIVEKALPESIIWALIASAIFAGTRHYQAIEGVPCALYKDKVED